MHRGMRRILTRNSSIIRPNGSNRHVRTHFMGCGTIVAHTQGQRSVRNAHRAGTGQPLVVLGQSLLTRSCRLPLRLKIPTRARKDAAGTPLQCLCCSSCVPRQGGTTATPTRPGCAVDARRTLELAGEFIILRVASSPCSGCRIVASYSWWVKP